MDDLQGLALALPLAVAFFVALVATPLSARLATRIGAVDRPSPRGVNQRPGMPLLGGIAVAAVPWCDRAVALTCFPTYRVRARGQTPTDETNAAPISRGSGTRPVPTGVMTGEGV